MWYNLKKGGLCVKKRIVMVLLALAVSSTVFVGCGNTAVKKIPNKKRQSVKRIQIREKLVSLNILKYPYFL